MPTANPKHADDTLRARDAQTVITPGIDAGPADGGRLEAEAAAKQSAPSVKSTAPWLITLVIIVGVLAIVLSAILLH